MPGLSTTVTVPSDAVLLISSDGGVAVNSGLTGAATVVDVVLTIDSVVVTNGGFRRITATNVAVTNGGVTTIIGFQSWSFAHGTTLSAGPHTFAIAAALSPAGGTAFSPNTATVSGNSASVLQGQLSIVIVKK